MNIQELGQLFITGISGLHLTEDEKLFIADQNIGGIILFKHNYTDPAQLAELINEIQTLRDEYPLFISVDQEGGRVQRFKTHFIQLPSMFKLAQLDSPKFTFDVHNALGAELSACGVNVNFSPCCDIWSNENNKVIGDRAFGRSVDSVEKHVSAAIRGLQASNVLACAKHFPGHGDTTKDSHFDLPYVKKTIDELRGFEVQPFIKASKSRIEFVMMAHLVVDALDKNFPCTLSKEAYKFLRSELKYQKIIITDDMEMQAITKSYTTGEAAQMALSAGADIVMYRTVEKAKEAYFSVRDAIKKQSLKNQVIGDKITRVLDCKKRFFKEYKPIYIPDVAKSFFDQKHKSLLDKINQ